MNTLEPCIILSPSSIEEECAKFTIEEVLSPFVLHNITTAGETYTLSLWVKSDNEGSIVSRGLTMPTTTEWARYTVTFTTKGANVDIYFNTADTYYIYHPKLERGSTASDWTEAPEDLDERIAGIQDTADAANTTANDNAQKITEAESLIQMLRDQIQMLVTDANGSSLMTQTADGGWTFSMAQTYHTIEDIQNTLSDLDGYLDSLDTSMLDVSKALDTVKSDIEWIKMTTFEDEPCIALGETGSDFKLLITNTRIMFMDGTDMPAYISNKALNITKAVIKEELQQGPFVWKIRANGNMGLLWKGVSS